MKTLLSIETDKEDKLNLLLQVAKEMGMTVEKSPSIDSYSIVSENSLGEVWNSEEDGQWDKLFPRLKK